MATDEEEKPESPGFFTEKLASPYVSIPLMLAQGVLAASGNAGARFANITNHGLALTLGLEGQADRRKKEQRLSQGVSDILKPKDKRTVSTQPGVDLSKTTFQMPPEKAIPNTEANITAMPSTLPAVDPNATYLSDWKGGGNPLAPPTLPTYQQEKVTPGVSVHDPQTAAYASVLAKGGHPEKAIALLATQQNREKPHVFGSNESGYHALQPDGSVKPLVPGTAKAPIYQNVDLGDKMAVYKMDPTSGARQLVDVLPKGSAPSRDKDPIDEAYKIAQIRNLTEGAPPRQLNALEAANLQSQIAERGKGKSVTNPNDWLTYDEKTGDVTQAPSDMSKEDLIKGGYREIRTLKDREAILNSGNALRVQLDKTKALAEEFKKTGALSLAAGRYTGGQLGASAGAAMEGTATQLVQLLEKGLGGVRAAGSKPLIDTAKRNLVPTIYDSKEVIDIKMKGWDVLVEGIADDAKRSAFGKGVNPKLKEEMDKYVEMVKEQGKKGRGEDKKPAAKGAAPAKAAGSAEEERLKKKFNLK